MSFNETFFSLPVWTKLLVKYYLLSFWTQNKDLLQTNSSLFPKSIWDSAKLISWNYNTLSSIQTHLLDTLLEDELVSNNEYKEKLSFLIYIHYTVFKVVFSFWDLSIYNRLPQNLHHCLKKFHCSFTKYWFSNQPFRQWRAYSLPSPIYINIFQVWFLHYSRHICSFSLCDCLLNSEKDILEIVVCIPHSFSPTWIS